MFICDECLLLKFYNQPRSLKSVGPCELCEQVHPCSDIQSGQLRRLPQPERAATPGQRKTDEPTV